MTVQGKWEEYDFGRAARSPNISGFSRWGFAVGGELGCDANGCSRPLDRTRLHKPTSAAGSRYHLLSILARLKSGPSPFQLSILRSWPIEPRPSPFSPPPPGLALGGNHGLVFSHAAAAMTFRRTT